MVSTVQTATQAVTSTAVLTQADAALLLPPTLGEQMNLALATARDIGEGRPLGGMQNPVGDVMTAYVGVDLTKPVLFSSGVPIQDRRCLQSRFVESARPIFDGRIAQYNFTRPEKVKFFLNEKMDEVPFDQMVAASLLTHSFASQYLNSVMEAALNQLTKNREATINSISIWEGLPYLAGVVGAILYVASWFYTGAQNEVLDLTGVGLLLTGVLAHSHNFNPAATGYTRAIRTALLLRERYTFDDNGHVHLPQR